MLSRYAVLEIKFSIVNMDMVIKVDIEVLIGIAVTLLKNVFKRCF